MHYDERLRLGTSAFTARGWPGSFYPRRLKPSEFLGYYAERFDAVEIDSTFYRAPTPVTARRWYRETPAGFTVAAKVPRAITHERCLLDCDNEWLEFVGAMGRLEEKLGPLVFQFPHFSGSPSLGEFCDRLKRFAAQLPEGHRYVVEVRNKEWIGPRLLELLRAHGMALALIDHPRMYPPQELMRLVDPGELANFTYIRWLGDRAGIERQTLSWDRTIVDRRAELESWAEICRELRSRAVDVYGLANNHYAGHGPATIRLFRELYGQAEPPLPSGSQRGFEFMMN